MNINNNNGVGGNASRRERVPRHSPWSYKKWDINTYISFHVFRTYILLKCNKQSFGGSVIISRKVVLTMLKRLGYSGDEVKAGIREVLVRYREAVVSKGGRWVEVDCGKFLELEVRVIPHLIKHSDVRRYLSEIDRVLKKMFFK